MLPASAPARPASLFWSALVTLIVLPGLAAAVPASAETVTAGPSGWMGSLPDDTGLAELSIPGTHDSGAWRGTVRSRTQDLTITGQLDAGGASWTCAPAITGTPSPSTAVPSTCT